MYLSDVLGLDVRMTKLSLLCFSRATSAALLTLSAVAALAQPVVYLCNGTYTDKPCKDGKEVDVAPTRGAHSMSGVRRESQEAVMERISRDIQENANKGSQQAAQIFRCAELKRQRQAIDASEAADQALKAQRFQIRQEQFALKCKAT